MSINHRRIDDLIWTALADLAQLLEDTDRMPAPGHEPKWEPDGEGHVHLTLMTVARTPPPVQADMDIDLTQCIDYDPLDPFRP